MDNQDAKPLANIPSAGVKIILLIAAVYVYIVAWEGNFGKALACIFAPGILTVEDDGQSTTGQS